MPVYRDEIVGSKWGSKRFIRDAADLVRRSKAKRLARLGKFTCQHSAATFPKNDGKVLVDAIGSSLRKTSLGRGAAAGLAMAPKWQQMEMRTYVGRVKSFEGDNVIAEIGPADDLDRWDVVIPRVSFRQEPQIDQEIDCKILRWGSHADVTVHALSNKRLPELKDFGIDEQELLNWASQLDV